MPFSILSCVYGKRSFPQRYVMVILACVAIIIAFGQRVNLSLIITVMVMPGNKTVSTECGVTNATKADASSSQYPWTEFEQQILLGIFFIGYFIFHVPGGFLSDRFGPRIVLSTAIMVSSIMTILTPPIVLYTHYWLFVVCRFIIGLAQAPIFPPSTTLMARWVPKHERATVGGIIFAANSFGIIAGSMFSGIIKCVVGNWESVFYFWGVVGLLWYVLFMLYVYSEPASHPHITDKEREMIEANVVKRDAKLKPNWLAILVDIAVWAMIAGQYGHSWMIFFLATNMPKYYKDVLKFDMKKNTLVSSLPYLLQWIASVGSGKIGDWMIKKKGFGVSFIRKLYTTIASVFPSLCLLAMPYCGCNSIMVTVFLCLSLLTMGPFYCGLKVNVIDVTINFSGIIMALVNGLGAISGFLSPYIIAHVAPDNTLAQWKVVMWIIFAGASVTNIIYIIWGKATRSKWDMMPDEWEVYKAQLDKDKAEKKAAKQAKKERKRAAKESKE